MDLLFKNDIGEILRKFKKIKNESNNINFVQKVEGIDDNLISFNQISLLLYQILKLIKEQLEPEKDIAKEKRYSNIVRASISFIVRQILALTICRTDDDSYKKFKILIERYAFFEHMPFYITTTYQSHEALLQCYFAYEPEAFGNSKHVEELERLLKEYEQANVS